MTNCEMGRFHLFEHLQTAVLACRLAVKTSLNRYYFSVWMIWVVDHTIVLASVQLFAGTGMDGVVEVRDNSLDCLSTPKVPNVGSAPPCFSVITLDFIELKVQPMHKICQI